MPSKLESVWSLGLPTTAQGPGHGKAEHTGNGKLLIGAGDIEDIEDYADDEELDLATEEVFEGVESLDDFDDDDDL